MITKNNSSSSIHSQHLSTSFVTSRSPQQGQAQHLEVRVPIEDPQLTVHGHYDPQNPQSPVHARKSSVKVTVTPVYLQESQSKKFTVNPTPHNPPDFH